jgi:hypothetical protein
MLTTYCLFGHTCDRCQNITDCALVYLDVAVED